MTDNSSYAAAPFDDGRADIILRSSDNIDFRVFKLLLSLASPFFDTLFSIPQPAQESDSQEIKDGLVVVPITEDGKTIDTFLRFCYPCTLVDNPNFKMSKDVVQVLEAARKYSLDVVEKKVRQAISAPQNLEKDPFRCFAIAYEGRLSEETRLAARHTLTQPLIPPWFEEIELISVTDLLFLLTYHRRCGDAVHALGFDLSWVSSHYQSWEACTWLLHRGASGKHIDCGCQSTNPPSKFKLFHLDPPQWWIEFMEGVFAALRERPCKETVEACSKKTIRKVVTQRSCYQCTAKVHEGMSGFLEVFTRKIEETVSGIELELTWEPGTGSKITTQAT